MSELKYKIGDKVRIKSLDWYNENKDKRGFICFDHANFIPEMSRYCGEILTINQVVEEYKHYRVSECAFSWTDEMIEGLAEEENKPEPKFKIGEVVYVIEYDTDLQIQNRIYKNGIWNYIINIESAPFIFYDNELKKKKEYPKTYEECCRVLGVSEFEYNHTGTKVWYRHKLMATLDKLMLCRDAYWKLYGEEIGLGKPWEPDWKNISDKYCIYFVSGDAWLKECQTRQCFFAFPTAEMRDAFKRNFDPDIEICKELL